MFAAIDLLEQLGLEPVVHAQKGDFMKYLYDFYSKKTRLQQAQLHAEDTLAGKLLEFQQYNETLA